MAISLVALGLTLVSIFFSPESLVGEEVVLLREEGWAETIRLCWELGVSEVAILDLTTTASFFLVGEGEVAATLVGDC
jgi:hypothetical protein